VNPLGEFNVSGICEGTDASITVQESENDLTYSILSNEGAIITSQQGNQSMLTLNIPADWLKAGNNRLTLKGISTTCTQRNSEGSINIHILSRPAPPQVTGGFHCNEGTVVLQAAAGENETVNWYGSLDATEPLGTSLIFETPNLQQTTSYYASVVNAGGCEGLRSEAIATIFNFEDAVIQVNKRMLSSNFETGNQWYFNDEPIAGATGQKYQATRAGIYRVDVTIGGCVTSNQVSYPLTPVHDKIEVYPNPFPSSLSFALPLTSGDFITLSVEELTGKKVLVRQLPASEDGLYEVDCSQLPTGFYLLRVNTGVDIQTARIQKGK
jgi:hypothetical protein